MACCVRMIPLVRSRRRKTICKAREQELQATCDLYAPAINFAHTQGRDIQDADAVIGKRP